MSLSLSPEHNPLDEAAEKMKAVHIARDDNSDDSEQQPQQNAKIEVVASSDSAAAPAVAAVPSSDLDAPFHLLPHSFCFSSVPAVRELYRKWNLDASCCALKVRYLASPNLADPAELSSFLASMMNSDAFRAEFRYMGPKRQMEPLPPDVEVRSLKLRSVRTSVTDLHFFDRLWEERDSSDGPIVFGSVDAPIPPLADPTSASAADIDRSAPRSNAGNIRQCFEDEVDGLTVSDELRRMLLDRDSDRYELYSPQERQELLFLLLQHLVVGGGMNQHEDNVYPYLSVLKLLYRDLLAVRTNRNTGNMEIANSVFRVEGMSVQRKDTAGEEAFPLFGKKAHDKHHLCLVSIEPAKKHATIYYFAHTDMW